MKNISREELETLALEKMQKESNTPARPSRAELEDMALKRMIGEQPVKPESRTGQALLEGYGQGASLGYLPHLQSMAAPLTDKIASFFTGEDAPAEVSRALEAQGFKVEDKDNYLDRRDNNIQRNKVLSDENPLAYGAGQVGGAIATSLLASPAQALTTAARLKQAAALGGAYGALSNPGDVEGIVADLQLEDRLKNGVVGVILGVGAQKGLDIIGKYSKPLANRIKQMAERRAASALGMQKHLRKAFSQDQIDDVGRYALDNKIIKPSLFGNTEKMVSRNKAALSQAGQKMDDVYSQLDDLGASTFNPKQVASNVDDELGGFWRDPINKAETSQFENTIETILNRGDDNLPFKEAQLLKEKFGKVANWKKNPADLTPKEKMAQEAYRVVSRSLDEAVDKSAENVGISGLKDALQGARKQYSAGKTAEKLLDNRVNMEQGNNAIGLTDFIVGSAGTASMGPQGLALVGVKKISEKYGNQATALFLDNVAKGLKRTPVLTEMATSRPNLFQAFVHKTAAGLEGSMGKAAVNSNEQKELKGRDRWIASGIEKVSENKTNKIDLNNPQVIEKLLFTPEGEKLLIEASDMKPGTPGMESVIKKIEKHLKEGKK
jgi:hypothetical protein